MCENTLLERIMAKLDEHGCNTAETVYPNGELRYDLGRLIKTTVQHELLFGGGLFERARLFNWAVTDQESCADESIGYSTHDTAARVNQACIELAALYDAETKPTTEQVLGRIVVMYAAVLTMEYTMRRKLGLTPGVDEALKQGGDGL